jgi:hypothetical protein
MQLDLVSRGRHADPRQQTPKNKACGGIHAA